MNDPTTPSWLVLTLIPFQVSISHTWKTWGKSMVYLRIGIRVGAGVGNATKKNAKNFFGKMRSFYQCRCPRPRRSSGRSLLALALASAVASTSQRKNNWKNKVFLPMPMPTPTPILRPKIVGIGVGVSSSIYQQKKIEKWSFSPNADADTDPQVWSNILPRICSKVA